MGNYTSIDWALFWNYGVFIISILLSIRLLVLPEKVKISNGILNILAIIIILFFVNEPIWYHSDKWNYKKSFEGILDISQNIKISDVGFYGFTKLIRLFTDSSFVYFLLLASIYLLGYLLFIKKFFSRNYRFVAFVLTISAMGFYAYGTNTISQGVALSLFLITIVNINNRWKAILFSLLAVSFHKSLIIPVLAFWIIKHFNLKNNFIYLWFLCLGLTLVFGNTLSVLIGDIFISYDDRIGGYLLNKSTSSTYNSGFKLNFLIYSIAPILYGLKMKKRINDEFYNKILSLYILVNAFWLLVIRIPFSDRFAYLSWFLIPFLFLYPLSKGNVVKYQNAIVALIVFCISTLSFLI